MATNKAIPTKPKSATTKKVVKKTLVVKKKTVKQIIESVKRKTTVSKSKVLTTAVTAKPIQLNEEHEARVAEWRAQDLELSG